MSDEHFQQVADAINEIFLMVLSGENNKYLLDARYTRWGRVEADIIEAVKNGMARQLAGYEESFQAYCEQEQHEQEQP